MDVASRQMAVRFVILLGLVSLFADVTYEGARSITGPFLSILGASGLVVGIVAGVGELVGYGLRLLSGYICDRTRKYWTITFLGYAINLLSVPLLALAGRWEIAAVLIVMERFGKAIRSPARDSMLAHATTTIGRGWGFGLHEAMDQIGAVSGPLFIAWSIFAKGEYRTAFAWLLIPALLSLTSLSVARILFPSPEKLDTMRPLPGRKGFPKNYWIYLAGASFVALGYADFPLMAFHLQKQGMQAAIPLLYALAMGVDAIAALVFGRMFDRRGLSVLIGAFFLSSFFAPLIFLTQHAIGGAILWGIGMGAQESIMRAYIAEAVPAEKRGSAYGMFHTVFGISWFAGSVVMGYLYDISVLWLSIFSVVAQLCALPILYRCALVPSRTVKPFDESEPTG